MALSPLVQLLMDTRGLPVNRGSVVHWVFPKTVVTVLLVARLMGMVKRAKKFAWHLVRRLVHIYLLLFLLATWPPHVYRLLGRRAMQRVLHKLPPFASAVQHNQVQRQPKL